MRGDHKADLGEPGGNAEPSDQLGTSEQTRAEADGENDSEKGKLLPLRVAPWMGARRRIAKGPYFEIYSET